MRSWFQRIGRMKSDRQSLWSYGYVKDVTVIEILFEPPPPGPDEFLDSVLCYIDRIYLFPRKKSAMGPASQQDSRILTTL